MRKNNRAARAVRTLLEFFDGVCQTTKLNEMKTTRVKQAKVYFAYFYNVTHKE